MRKLTAILIQFNRSFFPVNLSIDLILLAQWFISHPRDFLAEALVIKTAVYGFIILFQWMAGNNTWFYYRNAGFTIRKLFAYSCVLDMLISLVFFTFLCIL